MLTLTDKKWIYWMTYRWTQPNLCKLMFFSSFVHLFTIAVQSVEEKIQIHECSTCVWERLFFPFQCSLGASFKHLHWILCLNTAGTSVWMYHEISLDKTVEHDQHLTYRNFRIKPNNIRYKSGSKNEVSIHNIFAKQKRLGF